MIKRLLDIRRYHWIAVFGLAGVFAAVFAFATFNLFHYSMANLSFLKRHGLIAIQEGALLQTVEILNGGAFALFSYFGFKLCEGELIARFRLWSRSTD